MPNKNTFNQATLDKLVSKTAEKKNIRGAVFLVESKDRSISFCSVWGNVGHKSPYYVASINKLMLSFLTLRMVQEKTLHLDELLSSFLPEPLLKGIIVWKGTDFSGELTVKHLIAQTSGLPCYLIDKRPDGKKNMDLMLRGEDQSWPLEKVALEAKKMKPKFRPGAPKKAAYSETNFRLLGEVLAQKTGVTVRKLLEGLFQDLGMEDTYVLPEKEKDAPIPIYFNGTAVNIPNYWKSTQHDVASTAADQMKLIRGFFDYGYFPKDFIGNLFQWNDIFFPFSYGMGIQRFRIPRVFSPFMPVPELLGHCGSVGSVAFYAPEKDIYITGTINQPKKTNVAFATMVKILNQI